LSRVTVVAALLGLGSKEGGERFGEVAGADALEIQPGNQFLDAFGLPQVRRQDRRAELLSLLQRAAVLHPWLLDLDRPDAGEDGSLW
jgi:hypothetical protein